MACRSLGALDVQARAKDCRAVSYRAVYHTQSPSPPLAAVFLLKTGEPNTVKRILKFLLAAIRGTFLVMFRILKFLFSIPRRVKTLLAGGAAAGSLGYYFGSSIGIAGAFGGISGGIPGAVISALVAMLIMAVAYLWFRREDKKITVPYSGQDADKEKTL